MGSDYTTPSLFAEVLTQKMPLSEAFNRSQAGHVRAGVHHGLTLAWSDANWPLKKHATRYLKIRAGKAMVSPLKVENATSQDQVMVTVELMSDVIVDLEALSSPIAAGDANLYYVVLKITYVAPSVVPLTGLVSNPGSCEAKLTFELVSAKPGWSSDYGVVLGRFCRAHFHLEELRNSALARTDLSSESPFTDLPEVAKDAAASGIEDLMTSVNLNSYHGVGKRVRLRGLKDQDIGAAVMPLSDIAAAPAPNSNINNWKMPVNWLNGAFLSIYKTWRIWKDVGEFELLDSHFSGDLNLALHRTPGHSQVQNLVTDAPANIVDESVIRAMPDYGMKSMTIDMKGTVIEGNLTLDLVLDFTGEPHDLGVFRLFLRNMRVKGNLTVNVGQSWLGMAGGAQGVIEVENVVAYGNFNIRPWPQVKSVNADSAVTPAGSPAFPAWCNKVQHYLNNAGNITFTNYTLGGSPNVGPTVLQQWRRNVVPESMAWTKGPLILVYLHSKTAGTGGDFAMGDPWLKEGAEGGIRLKGSVIPEVNLLGESIHEVTLMSPTPAEQIRVSIQDCMWWKTRPVGSASFWNLIDKPVGYMASSFVYTLAEYKLAYFKYVGVENLVAEQAIRALGDEIVWGSIKGNTIEPRSGDTNSFTQKIAVDIIKEKTGSAGVTVGGGTNKSIVDDTSARLAAGSLTLGMKSTGLIANQSYSPGVGIVVREVRKKLVHVSGLNASAGLKIATLALPDWEIIGIMAHLQCLAVPYHLFGGFVRYPVGGGLGDFGLKFVSAVDAPPQNCNNGYFTVVPAFTHCLYISKVDGDLYYRSSGTSGADDPFDLSVEISHLNYV